MRVGGGQGPHMLGQTAWLYPKVKRTRLEKGRISHKETHWYNRDGYCNIWEHSIGMTGKVTF